MTPCRDDDRLRAVQPRPVGDRLRWWRGPFRQDRLHVRLLSRSPILLAALMPSDGQAFSWVSWKERVWSYARPLRVARKNAQREYLTGIKAAKRRSGVGESLLDFFSDLAAWCRLTPAPCPWCGCAHILWIKESGSMFSRCVCMQCDANGPEEPSRLPRQWNAVAIPVAYRRLTP